MDGILGTDTARFADDAVLNHPAGTFTGSEIASFYRDLVLVGQTVLACGAVVANGSVVMAEFEASSPLGPNDGRVYAIDVFRLDRTGHIETLDIYYR